MTSKVGDQLHCFSQSVKSWTTVVVLVRIVTTAPSVIVDFSDDCRRFVKLMLLYNAIQTVRGAFQSIQVVDDGLHTDT